MKTTISLINGKQEFVWGEVLKIHRIGEYEIVEFIGVFNGKREEGVSFHVYIAGKDTSHSFGSLDSALVGAIAYKHEGPNHRADQYFCKMVEME
jgi:hypothetical protein